MPETLGIIIVLLVAGMVLFAGWMRNRHPQRLRLDSWMLHRHHQRSASIHEIVISRRGLRVTEYSRTLGRTVFIPPPQHSEVQNAKGALANLRDQLQENGAYPDETQIEPLRNFLREQVSLL